MNNQPLPATLSVLANSVDAPVGGASVTTPSVIAYLRAVLLYKWRILGLALLCALVALAVALQIAPRYRSTALLYIEPGTPRPLPIDDLYGGSKSDREYFLSQTEILRSRELAWRVIRDLDLQKRKEFAFAPRSKSAFRSHVEESIPWLAEWLFANMPVQPAERAVSERVTREFEAGLKIEPVRLSHLVKIHFDSTDPTLASDVANALGEAYIRQDLDARGSVNVTAGDSIARSVETLKRQLETSEKALQEFRDTQGMADAKNSLAAGNTGVQIDMLTQRLVEARTRRIEAEQVARAVRSGDATGVRTAGMQRALDAESAASRRMADAAQRYDKQHPTYAAAAAELAAAKIDTQRELASAFANVERDVEAARAAEYAVDRSLEQARAAARSNDRKEKNSRLAELEREVASNRQLYQSFQARSKETQASASVQLASARFVERAQPSTIPSWPPKTIMVIASALAGLVLGTLLALARKRFDRMVHTSDDVELKLGQSFLAALPILTKARAGGRIALDTLQDTDSAYSEAVQTVATSVLLSTAGARSRVVMVTSTVPGEGKSTFATALALSQARKHRVLLIDADMRRPALETILGVPPYGRGLADLLSGLVPEHECIISASGIKLDVLPAGNAPQNPLELLGSPALVDLIGRLSQRFDLIVIDSPPLMAVADAQMLSRIATQTIYVVKANSTTTPNIIKGLRKLSSVGARVLGVVLNQQDPKKAEKYFGEYPGYSTYGYGRTRPIPPPGSITPS